MAQFTPQNPPPFTDINEAVKWIMEQFELLVRANAELIAVDLRPVGREPDKPREGMIVSADGVGWNPGSGAGAYEYKGGAWVKL